MLWIKFDSNYSQYGTNLDCMYYFLIFSAYKLSPKWTAIRMAELIESCVPSRIPWVYVTVKWTKRSRRMLLEAWWWTRGQFVKRFFVNHLTRLSARQDFIGKKAYFIFRKCQVSLEIGLA